TNKPILINYLPIEAGEEISLMANGCLSLTYEWQGLGTGQAFLVMPLETTNYRVFCRNETCRSDVSSALITVLQPIISSTASEICFQSGTGSKNSATLTIEHCNGF